MWAERVQNLIPRTVSKTRSKALLAWAVSTNSQVSRKGRNIYVFLLHSICVTTNGLFQLTVSDMRDMQTWRETQLGTESVRLSTVQVMVLGEIRSLRMKKFIAVLPIGGEEEITVVYLTATCIIKLPSLVLTSCFTLVRYLEIIFLPLRYYSDW